MGGTYHRRNILACQKLFHKCLQKSLQQVPPASPSSSSKRDGGSEGDARGKRGRGRAERVLESSEWRQRRRVRGGHATGQPRGLAWRGSGAEPAERAQVGVHAAAPGWQAPAERACPPGVWQACIEMYACLGKARQRKLAGEEPL